MDIGFEGVSYYSVNLFGLLEEGDVVGVQVYNFLREGEGSSVFISAIVEHVEYRFITNTNEQTYTKAGGYRTGNVYVKALPRGTCMPIHASGL